MIRFLYVVLFALLSVNVAFGQQIHDGTIAVKIDNVTAQLPITVMVHDGTTFFAGKLHMQGSDRYIAGMIVDGKPRVYYLSSGGNDYTGGRDGKIHLKKKPGSTYPFSAEVKIARAESINIPIEKTTYGLKIGGVSVGNVTFVSFSVDGKKFGFTKFKHAGKTRYIAGMLNDGNLYKGVYVSSDSWNYYFGTQEKDGNFVGGMIKEGFVSRQSFVLVKSSQKKESEEQRLLQ